MFEWMSLGFTILVYLLCTKVYRRWSLVVLNPMLTTLIVLIVLLSLTHIPYSTYMGGGRVLTYMLNPATVAFAIPLYKNVHLVKKHAREIAVSLSAGSVVAVVTSVLFAHAADLNLSIRESLAPRSVTTPIAMQISQTLGGVPVLTAVFVIVTALVVLTAGPIYIRWLRIRTPIARGMLLGMSAHGLGTSMAFELGEIEGTFASLSMILAAGLTILVAPLLSGVIT